MRAESGPGGGTGDAVVLQASVPSRGGARPVTVTLRYAAVRQLRKCFTAPEGQEPSWPTGLLFGSLSDDAISIDHAAVAPAHGSPIGIFRAQPGGWALLTDADRKKLSSAGLANGMLLVVRTLKARPWSATLFAAGAPAESDGQVIEFPLDEYALRNGWLLDSTAPPPVREAPARRRAGLRGRWVAAAAVLLAGGAATYWLPPPGALFGRAAVGAPQGIERAPRGLALQVSRKGNDVEISWNRLSDAVRRAVTGTLTIRNGPLTRVFPLGPEQLREDRILFHPLSAMDAEFRLEVLDALGQEQSDAVELLGSPAVLDLNAPDPAPSKPSPLVEQPRNSTLPRQRALVEKPPASPPRKPQTLVEEPRTSTPRIAERQIQPVKTLLSITDPVPISKVRPEITPKVRAEMRAAKGRVTVSVQVSIDAAGNVDSAKVLSSTGEPSPSGPYIRLASLDAARQWKFRPATEGGSVPSRTTLVFDF